MRSASSNTPNQPSCQLHPNFEAVKISFGSLTQQWQITLSNVYKIEEYVWMGHFPIAAWIYRKISAHIHNITWRDVRRWRCVRWDLPIRWPCACALTWNARGFSGQNVASEHGTLKRWWDDLVLGITGNNGRPWEKKQINNTDTQFFRVDYTMIHILTNKKLLLHNAKQIQFIEWDLSAKIAIDWISSPIFRPYQDREKTNNIYPSRYKETKMVDQWYQCVAV